MASLTTTTITILGSRLLLVRIPLDRMNASMHAILDVWWHRTASDPFFALCHNGVELSLFADADTIAESAFGKLVRGRRALDSSFTLRQAGDEDEIRVGDQEWVALELSFHGGWREAGQRVRDISSPLAEEGISILFLSTYMSDCALSSLVHAA